MGNIRGSEEVRGVHAHVAQIQKGLMSVSAMVDAGHEVIFKKDPGGRDVSGAVSSDGSFVPFVRRQGIYEIDFAEGTVAEDQTAAQAQPAVPEGGMRLRQARGDVEIEGLPTQKERRQIAMKDLPQCLQAPQTSSVREALPMAPESSQTTMATQYPQPNSLPQVHLPQAAESTTQHPVHIPDHQYGDTDMDTGGGTQDGDQDTMMGTLHSLGLDVPRLEELHALAAESAKLGRPVTIAEVYNDGKFNIMGKKMFGYEPNIVADLRTGWNFLRAHDRRRLCMMLAERPPDLAILSPVCTGFSQLQNMSRPSRQKYQTYLDCQRHLKFCCQIITQLLSRKKGRTRILLEQPDGASSWGEQCMLILMRKFPQLTRVRGDQCPFGPHEEWPRA